MRLMGLALLDEVSVRDLELRELASQGLHLIDLCREICYQLVFLSDLLLEI